GQRLASAAEVLRPQRVLHEGQLRTVAAGRLAQDAERDGHHLGADPVARQDRDAVAAHRSSLVPTLCLTFLVPTLCVGTALRRSASRLASDGTQSVPSGVPTQSVGTRGLELTPSSP